MPYAILRVQKLKSRSAITHSAKHTERTAETPNADPKTTNIELIPNINNLDLVQLVDQKIAGIKHRKDAVLCAEYFLGASPEYFRPDAPERAGYYQPERLETWINANLEWLQTKHGDNLVKATVHLDEATPHIAAYVVSVHPDPKTGKKKLSYNTDFGGNRHRLSQLQDEYATAMAPLGLERGIKSSKAEHRDIQQYYAEVNQTLQQQRQSWAEQIGEMALLEWGYRGGNYRRDRYQVILQPDSKTLTIVDDQRGVLLQREGNRTVQVAEALTSEDAIYWMRVGRNVILKARTDVLTAAKLNATAHKR